MQGSKPPNQMKTDRKTSRPRAVDMVVATTSESTTVSRVMEHMPADSAGPAIGADDKKVLQSIAHGAEGFGSEYGSGPGAANADPDSYSSPPVPGDSASPAASALATRKSAKSNRQQQ